MKPVLSKQTILMVEDDDTVADLAVPYFTEMGFNIVRERTLAAARQRLGGAVDMVLLDVMLPDGDGRTFIEEIRKRSRAGVILLTQMGQLVEKVVGLELGADDYVVKPFEPRELLARVKALLRRLARADERPASDEVRFGGWILYPAARKLVSDAGEEARLTRMEFELLAALVLNMGKAMTRDQLMDAIGKHWVPLDRTVDVLVGRVRKKLEGHGTASGMIETVYGSGYLCRREE